MIAQNLSLFMPRVFTNIPKSFIQRVFEDAKFGKVDAIDFVTRTDVNGKKYNNVFIHFEYWCDNISVQHFQDNVFSSNCEARMVYDDPWYWVVLENTGSKKVKIHCNRPKQEPKTARPTIIMDDDEETLLDLSDDETYDELNTGFLSEDDIIQNMHCFTGDEDSDSIFTVGESCTNLVDSKYVETLEMQLDIARRTIDMLNAKTKAMEEELWSKFRPIDEDEDDKSVCEINMNQEFPSLISRYGSVAPDFNNTDISVQNDDESDYDYDDELVGI